MVLGGVLAVTLWFGYGVSRTPAPTPVPAATQEVQSMAAPQAGARIRLDLVENLHAEDEIGRNNVFQYRIRRAAPANASESSGSGGAATPPPVEAAPVPPAPQGPPPPPPPPPIPFKYRGFANVEKPSSLIAFLADDANHYNVTIGEILMGRYRVSRITLTDVEMEDLQLNRRQTLPLIR